METDNGEAANFMACHAPCHRPLRPAFWFGPKQNAKFFRHVAGVGSLCGLHLISLCATYNP